jgi:hypothetical protein
MLRSSLRLDSGGQRVASWTATRRPSQKRFMASMRVKKLEVTPFPKPRPFQFWDSLSQKRALGTEPLTRPSLWRGCDLFCAGWMQSPIEFF